MFIVKGVFLAMAKKNWEKVAQKEFDAMDQDARKDWADLRDRISRRHRQFV